MKLAYRNRQNAKAAAAYWNKPLDRPDWFSIENKAGEDEAEISIYDVIGWPFIMADEFTRELSQVQAKHITVRINSPGGDVFDGTAIFNALRNHPATITTRIEGLAASIASVIALAGDEVQAHANTMFMIHNAWALAIGNQHELREVADILAKIDGNILDVYYAKAGTAKASIRQMMDVETWMTAAEAKDKGFIDTVLDGDTNAKAQFDLSMFAHAPEGCGAPYEPTIRDQERALRDVGLSLSEAKAFLAGRRNSHDAEQNDLIAAARQTLTIFEGV